MTIQMLRQWKGLEALGVYTLAPAEEARLAGIGHARTYTGPDNPSQPPVVAASVTPETLVASVTTASPAQRQQIAEILGTGAAVPSVDAADVAAAIAGANALQVQQIAQLLGVNTGALTVATVQTLFAGATEAEKTALRAALGVTSGPAGRQVITAPTWSGVLQVATLATLVPGTYTTEGGHLRRWQWVAVDGTGAITWASALSATLESLVPVALATQSGYPREVFVDALGAIVDAYPATRNGVTVVGPFAGLPARPTAQQWVDGARGGWGLNIGQTIGAYQIGADLAYEDSMIDLVPANDGANVRITLRASANGTATTVDGTLGAGVLPALWAQMDRAVALNLWITLCPTMNYRRFAGDGSEYYASDPSETAVADADVVPRGINIIDHVVAAVEARYPNYQRIAYEVINEPNDARESTLQSLYELAAAVIEARSNRPIFFAPPKGGGVRGLRMLNTAFLTAKPNRGVHVHTYDKGTYTHPKANTTSTYTPGQAVAQRNLFKNIKLWGDREGITAIHVGEAGVCVVGNNDPVYGKGYAIDGWDKYHYVQQGLLLEYGYSGSAWNVAGDFAVAEKVGAAYQLKAGMAAAFRRINGPDPGVPQPNLISLAGATVSVCKTPGGVGDSTDYQVNADHVIVGAALAADVPYAQRGYLQIHLPLGAALKPNTDYQLCVVLERGADVTTKLIQNGSAWATTWATQWWVDPGADKISHTDKDGNVHAAIDAIDADKKTLCYTFRTGATVGADHRAHCILWGATAGSARIELDLREAA